MTSSITDILGALPWPEGATMPLDWNEVSSHLEKVVGSKAEAERQERARWRTELYTDGGEKQLLDMVQCVFSNPEVQQLRKAWVPFARFNNVTRRIVHELSTIYRSPAVRTVSARPERYLELQRLVRKDQVMRHVNRMLNLHRRLLVGFRTRRGDRRPVLDVVLPENFWVLAHPLDPSQPVAFIMRQRGDGPRVKETDPFFVMWTDHEVCKLDQKGRVIESTIREHGLARMPWLIVRAEPEGALMDDTIGEDIVAAHRSVWLQMVQLLKESKSLVHQTVLQGDLSTAVRDQAQDTERDLVLPEGVTATSLDRGVDLQQYIAVAREIIDVCGTNHGIAPALMRHEGASSGFEIELRRLGIRERRLEQLPIYWELERELAEIEAMVCAKDRPDLAFSVEGWRIDFPEPEVPLSPMEQDTVFETRRRLGLTDTIEELIRRNPDLDEDGAWTLLEKRVENELRRNILMRPLQEISGSLGADTPDGEAPQDGSQEARGGRPKLDRDTAETIGTLIRAGAKPESVVAAVGVPAIEFYEDLRPITLKTEAAVDLPPSEKAIAEEESDDDDEPGDSGDPGAQRDPAAPPPFGGERFGGGG